MKTLIDSLFIYSVAVPGLAVSVLTALLSGFSNAFIFLIESMRVISHFAVARHWPFHTLLEFPAVILHRNTQEGVLLFETAGNCDC